MSKKKSLGHNPLAYSTFGDSSFDFISSSEEKREAKEEIKKPQKSVVSYYLEDPLVSRIRKKADEEEKSYSAYVNELLKKSMNEETDN
ncbi:MAG: hypothetical protein FH748_08815 [Balneolaceae bacterium]|nr:hypothetical protein [Balneolaceae bacterium]